KEVTAAPAIVAPEDDLRPASHAGGRVPVAEQPQSLAGDGVDQHAFVTRTAELRRGEHFVPYAQPPDVFVFARTVRQFQQRWRPPVNDCRNQPERKRIGDAADGTPEPVRDDVGQLTQAVLPAAADPPLRTIDVAGEGVLLVTVVTRQPALA